MMYNVIILQDLRYRPSTLKRSVSVFKKVTLGTVFKACFFWCPKAPFTSERRKKNLSFQNEYCSVKIAEYWPRSIYY